MFSFAGTAQEAGAGGRSGVDGIPVIDGAFFFMYYNSFVHFSFGPLWLSG